MVEVELLVNLHKNADRQGPGSNHETKKALELVEIDNTKELKILDIGCGTGAQSITLAENLKGTIHAVDLFPEFLERLNERAKEKGLSDRIITTNESMENLTFGKQEFDIIWSEGAIYIMGFENGINYWKQFLKPDGIIAVSEISWLTNERPQEVEDYWKREYTEIDVISNKIRILENNGYTPTAHFILPDYCWMDNYYTPMQKQFPEFLVKHGDNPNALKLVENEMKEIDFYNKFKDYFGYVFYMARLKE